MLECFYSRRKALSESVIRREWEAEFPQEIATTQDRQTCESMSQDRQICESILFFLEDEAEEEVREEEEEA